MSEISSQARPLSIDNIRQFAQQTKDLLGFSGVARLPMARIIEFALPSILPTFVYDVKTLSAMGANHGIAMPDRDYIALREDVFEGASRGEGRDRFTVAHELGHLMLHQSENLVMPRRLPNARREPAIFCQPEWQADTFAAEFLMDSRLCDEIEDEIVMARTFGVSVSAARRRVKSLRRAKELERRSERKSEPWLSPGSRRKS